MEVIMTRIIINFNIVVYKKEIFIIKLRVLIIINFIECVFFVGVGVSKGGLLNI